MAQALRHLSPARGRLPAAGLAISLALPLLWAAAAAVRAGLDAAAWRELLADPQTVRALAMTLWTGLCATALSVALAAWVLSRSFPGPGWAGLVQRLPPMLAVPHAALAIGLAFLVAPSGWVLRLFSPWATGFEAPPPWPTTQDPWGLGLIVVLVAKEVPFLLWMAATQLQRADAANRFTRELQVASSMGYSPRRAWWRVLWPQLAPRMGGPLLAVLAYSLTVVDMALVIGPTSPSTLPVLAWQWLQDADAATNAKGAAAAWALAAVVALAAAALWARWHMPRTAPDGLRGGNERLVAVPTGRWNRLARVAGRMAVPGTGLVILYSAALLTLAVGSVSGVWPFPRVWPQTLSLEGWQSVAASAVTVRTTLALAGASSALALAWSLAWLEWAPPHWDAALRRLVYLPLLLPSVLWVVGLHRLGLAWGLDAHWSGLLLAHTLAAVPYVLIAMSPAYLGFDERYGQIAATLRRSRAAYLLQVKWPLLKASLASALAVGFAVSVAQYLPTLFVGAGRYATVTTEAVTLASGAQRSLVAAYAWLQWLLPALVFGLAAWAGRPRRFDGRAA